MDAKDISFIQDQIGYNFKNTDLLQQAFVRRSYSHENGGENNEVLEFIGDKVLDFIVVKLLSDKFGYTKGKLDDFDSENDQAVTIRDRDTMEQVRVPIAELKNWFDEKFDF